MQLLERRYARALIDLATSSGKLDLYEEQLGLLYNVFDCSPELAGFLENPQEKKESKKALLQRLLKDGLDADIFNFLLLLVDKERTSYLLGIYCEYKVMAEEKRRIVNMIVASAFPITPEQLDGLAEKFRRLHGAARVNIETCIEPELLGGVRITIGDRIYDSTIKGRLDALKKKLLR